MQLAAGTQHRHVAREQYAVESLATARHHQRATTQSSDNFEALVVNRNLVDLKLARQIARSRL